jgi:REP element-mobilizing transposase RayT
MPRKIRIQYEGASYHIMSRGDQYEPIFLSHKDRYSFLKTLDETCERTGWVIHAYVLLDNHYHMLVETPEANLVDGMKWFQSWRTDSFITQGFAVYLPGPLHKPYIRDRRALP